MMLALTRFRGLLAFMGIVNLYRAAGDVLPGASAMRELQLRDRLEDFRDFASERIMEDTSLPVERIKQEWIDLRLKPLSRIAGGYEDVLILKKTVADMPIREIFHPTAMCAWEAHAQSLMRRA